MDLVAASRDMVHASLEAVKLAGLSPLMVDLTPFAVARAVSPAARGEAGIAGAEAIVDVGSGVTSVYIHQGGEPRFVRILLVGGDDATNALATEMGVSFDEAEAVKLDLGRGVGTPEAQRTLQTRVAALVEEIRGSLDYYLAQSQSSPITRVLVTGGASRTAGLMERLQSQVFIDFISGCYNRRAFEEHLNVARLATGAVTRRRHRLAQGACRNRERQREADALAQQEHHSICDRRGDDQRGDGDQAEPAVVEQAVDHDEDQTNDAGEQTGVERVLAQRRRRDRLRGRGLPRPCHGAVLAAPPQR